MIKAFLFHSVQGAFSTPHNIYSNQCTKCLFRCQKVAVILRKMRKSAIFILETQKRIKQGVSVFHKSRIIQRNTKFHKRYNYLCNRFTAFRFINAKRVSSVFVLLRGQYFNIPVFHRQIQLQALYQYRLRGYN